jgi:phage tail sheath gpL-like
MTISTSVPASVRRPGTYQQLDVTTNARGLVPIQRRVALLGAKTAAGTAAVSVPVQIFSESQADALCGAGSELALMGRGSIRAGALYGSSPEIWVVPIADPGSGAFDVHTLTITGPATASGNLTFQVAGKNVVVGVASGDVANTIAANIQLALLAIVATLPITPTVATNVNTLTANNKGINGADITIGPITAPLGVSVAVAHGTTGSGAYDIQPALDACIDKTYHGMAFATHATADVAKIAAHLDQVSDPGFKAFSIAYLAEPGTLTTGTTLATTSNRRDIVACSCTAFPNMPGEIAAHVATSVEGEDNTVLPFNNVELALAPPPLVSVPTPAMIETALAAGLSVLSISPNQTRVKIIKLVTTMATFNSAPFYQVAELSVVRTLYWLMSQIDFAWAIAFPRAIRDLRTDEQVWDVTYDVLKKAEDARRIQNVDAHKGELIVERDATVTTRDNVAIPASVVSPLNQLVGKTTLFLE